MFFITSISHTQSIRPAENSVKYSRKQIVRIKPILIIFYCCFARVTYLSMLNSGYRVHDSKNDNWHCNYAYRPVPEAPYITAVHIDSLNNCSIHDVNIEIILYRFM